MDPPHWWDWSCWDGIVLGNFGSSLVQSFGSPVFAASLAFAELKVLELDVRATGFQLGLTPASTFCFDALSQLFPVLVLSSDGSLMSPSSWQG